MSMLRRSVVVLLALGSLLSLSACGSPPPATAAYQATVITQNGHRASYPLVLAADGHFVLDIGPGGAPFKGSWTERNNDVTLTGSGSYTLTGTRGRAINLILDAKQVGTGLRDGGSEMTGQPRPQASSLFAWYAVRV